MPRPEGPMINERCMRFRELRLIGSDGAQLGVLPSRDALNMAKNEGLDLVLVATSAQPPVARIIDYGKYKYELEKLKKSNKKKILDLKNIKFRPGTSEHDLGHLMKHAEKFLADGHKVKVICQFRAREIAHPEIGRKKMLYVAEKLGSVSVIDKPVTMEGRMMTMVLSPEAAKALSPQVEKPKSVSVGTESSESIINQINKQEQEKEQEKIEIQIEGVENAKDKDTQNSSETV